MLSIFGTFGRALIKTIAVVLGILIALMLFALLVGVVSSKSDGPEPIQPTTRLKMLNAQPFTRSNYEPGLPTILQINIEGVIGSPVMRAEDVELILTESREGKLKENPISAILLYVNSPGGTVVDSGKIRHMLLDYKKLFEVPVYAYTEGLCASGAYEISLACDQIFANDNALVGSVGVVLPTFFNYTKLMETVGIQSKTLSEGINKDQMNPFRPWKESEADSLKSIMNEFYERFVNMVVEARPTVSVENLKKELGANIFTADNAKRLGLIDEVVLSREGALKALQERLGVEKIQLIMLEEKNWWKTFMNSEEIQGLKQIYHYHSLSNPIDEQFSSKKSSYGPLQLFQPS